MTKEIKNYEKKFNEEIEALNKLKIKEITKEKEKIYNSLKKERELKNKEKDKEIKELKKEQEKKLKE